MASLVLKYTKAGTVAVAAPGYEPINFEDPAGEVLGLPVDTSDGVCRVVSKITDADGRNAILREHPVTLDLAARQAWVEFFFLHVARLAREAFPEFSDLEIHPETLQALALQGIDLSFLQGG